MKLVLPRNGSRRVFSHVRFLLFRGKEGRKGGEEERKQGEGGRGKRKEPTARGDLFT